MSSHQESRLPFREMLAFGCGDFASVLYWQTYMKYLPFFYTDVFGLTAAALASMLFFSRIFDGFFDPVIGMLADRTESRWGKFRPFMLFGCVPFAIFGFLTFTTPGLGPAGKLIWAYLTYNAMMLLYTTVNIPYTALLGVMTNNPVERTRLSSIKFVCAFSAGMVVSATLLPMVSWLGRGNQQHGWSMAFIVIGLVAVGFFLITVFGTKERIKPAPDANTSVARDLKLLFANKAWVLLTITTLLWILFIAVRSSVSAHYFKYFLYNGNPDTPLAFVGRTFTLDTLLSAFNTLGQAAAVAGVMLIGLIADRFPKRALFVTLLVLQIAATASYYFLPAGALGAIFILEILGSFVGAPLPVLLWAMYADTADYGEWQSGRRTTALVFSASLMSQKMGWAIAAFIAFQLLAFVGFQANIVPSVEVKDSLVHLMSIIPAVLGLASIITFLLYPLNDQRVAEINAELKARREQAGLATS